jgi:CheY-like chemotaxis protein
VRQFHATGRHHGRYPFRIKRNHCTVPPLLAGLRILILEDEYLIAMDVEQLCRDHGAGDVVIAADLSDLADEEVGASFDAAIIDLLLNGNSTLEFASRLRDKQVPFVFASGYSEPAEIQDSFPGVMLVGKPYSGADLIEALAIACGRLPSQLAGEPIT